MGYESREYSLYAYARSAPVFLLDSLGFEACKPHWNNDGCFRISDFRFVGTSWGEYAHPFVGDRWWIRGAAYISGDVYIQLIINDKVECCCPKRYVEVHGGLDVHLAIEYWKVAERWQILQRVGESLFFPWWAKAVLFGDNIVGLNNLIKKSLPEGVVDLTAAGVCASGLNSIGFGYRNITLNVKFGPAPGRSNRHDDPTNINVDIGDAIGDLRWCPGSGLELYNSDIPSGGIPARYRPPIIGPKW